MRVIPLFIDTLNIECLKNTPISLDGFHWDEHGFQIHLLNGYLAQSPESSAFETDATIRVKIIFPPDVLSVRVLSEMQSWKIQDQMFIWRQALEAQQKYFYPIFVVSASEYIDWYKETETIDAPYRYQNLKHYFFFIDYVRIEVIDDRLPTIIEERI